MCAHWKYNLQKGGLSLNNNAEKGVCLRTDQNFFLSSREFFDTDGRKTVKKELATLWQQRVKREVSVSHQADDIQQVHQATKHIF